MKPLSLVYGPRTCRTYRSHGSSCKFARRTRVFTTRGEIIFGIFMGPMSPMGFDPMGTEIARLVSQE